VQIGRRSPKASVFRLARKPSFQRYFGYPIDLDDREAGTNREGAGDFAKVVATLG
jgi:hypothetical protein